MTDFLLARRMMVDGQIRTSDVTDSRLIDAMLEVPRELFVPQERSKLAYLDLDILVSESGDGGTQRRLLKPMVLAKLIQALDIREGDRVLDVAGATGYAAALLAKLGASVVMLEEEPGLARQAQDIIAAGFADLPVEVVSGPLTEGWSAGGPYDAILVEGASEIKPESLFGQLKPGGRLAILSAGLAGRAMLYRVADGDVDVGGRPVFDAAGPLLPGFAKSPVFTF